MPENVNNLQQNIILEQENNFLEKFKIIVLPTQAGKTFQVINKIVNSIEEDIKNNEDNIIIINTMNTLLSNEQFNIRVADTIIKEKYGSQSICTLSSDKSRENNIKTYNELLGKCYIKRTRPRIIIMCSNKIRFNDILQFVQIIHESNQESKSPLIKKVSIYFDELHKYIAWLEEVLEVPISIISVGPDRKQTLFR